MLKRITTGVNRSLVRTMSGYTVDYMERKVNEKLPSLRHLQVTDISCGCGAKFDMVIVSDAFNGKPLIERHRMVNDIFKEELKEIHALTLKTLTPEQFEKLKTN